MKLHKAAHTVYKTQYHIVWVTRYRRRILVRGIAESLRILLQEVQKFHPDWFIEEIGIEVDHVHLHMVIPPKDAVAKVSGHAEERDECRDEEEISAFPAQGVLGWPGDLGRGFFVSTIGINEAIIRRYVR